jgi:hypothetical protein
LVDGRKKESRLEGCSSLEKMEVGRDNVGSLKFKKNFTKLFGFGSITYYWISYKA